jgi:heme-degrading monooxygenase HmoA
MPELREIEGFAGSQLLQREASDRVEVTVVTFWETIEAIDVFAGTDREAAVVAPEAAALLTDFDRRVRHYEVAFSHLRAASN